MKESASGHIRALDARVSAPESTSRRATSWFGPTLALIHSHMLPRSAAPHGSRNCMAGTTVSEAFAMCEAIAEERAHATQSNAYADGYRSAAHDIARAIRARRRGLPPTQLERELRDVEVEARTLARVVDVAAALADTLEPDAAPTDTLRCVLLVFFNEEDLPLSLRQRYPCESTTRLVTGSDVAEGMVDAPRRQDAGATTTRTRKPRRRAN